MVVLRIDKQDVDKNFSLQELKEFSKRPNTKVIISGVMTLEAGGITKLNNIKGDK